MTETEMITLFHQRYDNSSFTNQELGDDEIYLFLNLEVERFLNTRFTGNNVRQQGFEEDQKRIDDVRTLLIVSAEISSFASGVEIPNSKIVDMSVAALSNYRFYVKSYSKINKTVDGVVYTDSWISNEIIKNEEVEGFIKTAFNKPILEHPKVVFRDSDLTVIYDDETTVTGFKLQYIKQPDKIASGVNCNLPDHAHEEIVEGAVSLALETDESKRFQTETSKLQTQE